MVGEKAIAAANNTARDTLEKALVKSGVDAAVAAATAKATVDLTFATAPRYCRHDKRLARRLPLT